jgi:lipoyl(octanoyl) transferase
MILTVIDLGVMAYDKALAYQEELVKERKAGDIGDTLLLLEHEPVYTLGRSANEENLLSTPAELEKKGIKVFQTTRGGDVTYHGPGQLVGYPIIDLGRDSRKVVWYVDMLEKIIVDTLAQYGIKARGDRKNRGVWIGDTKIAAIGVKVAGHVTMHGFSLNIRVNLSDYDGIVPCGIRDKGVTSLHLHVDDVKMAEVKKRVIDNFVKLFGYNKIS